MSRIEEKKHLVSTEIGKDYQTVEDNKRKHDIFAQDVKAISTQVSFFYRFYNLMCMLFILILIKLSKIFHKN